MRYFLFTLMLLATLSMVACGNSANDATVISTSPSEQIDPGLNLLIVVEGKVRLKRDDWPAYHPTAFGAALGRGDQLYPEQGAKALVLCDGLTIWTVPPGVPSGLTNGCPPVPAPPLVRGISLIGSTRGGSDPFIPYIISPRMTRILSDRPTLQWNAVRGVSSYTVQVRGEDLQWETEVDEDRIVYPGEPPLELGGTYLLIVTADNGSSSGDEGAVGLGFTLLTEEEAAPVHAAVEQLKAFGLPSEAEAFALAQLYAGQGLIAEAIETLEALATTGNQETAVYRVLGDLYQRIGLNPMGEKYYLKAIELASAEGDVEGLAAAQAGLGEIYVELENVSEAINWLEQALDSYRTLEDTQNIEKLMARIKVVEP